MGGIELSKFFFRPTGSPTGVERVQKAKDRRRWGDLFLRKGNTRKKKEKDRKPVKGFASF